MAKTKKTPSDELVDLSKDWKRLRQQKHRSRGGVEARILQNLGMYYGEQYMRQARDTMLSRPLGKDDDKNRLFLVFNLIRKAVRRKVGRIWSVAPEFAASPNRRDPRAYDQADVVNELILGVNQKVKERQQHWLRLWWAAIGGVVVEHTPWIEDVGDEPLPQFDPDSGELLWKDQITQGILPQSMVEQLCQQGISPERFAIVEHLTSVGDVGSEIIDPLSFFIDASIPTIKQLGPKQRCYIAKIRTVEWIRETFGSDLADQVNGTNMDLSIVQTRLLDHGPSVANINLRDLIPSIQGTRGPNDPDMAIVITGYEPPCSDYPHGRRAIFVPEQVVLDDGDLEYPEIPCTDLHWGPPATGFWTEDFITDQIAPQKFFNKRLSQLGEASNASIYEVLLTGQEIGREDIPTDMPGVVQGGLGEDGAPRVQPLQRGQLPVWFLESIKLIVESFNDIASSDLNSSRQFPGQLRGPLAIPMLQELLDSEDGPFFDHMGEQLSSIHQKRINLVKQFYPPVRTLNYAGKNNKDEVLVFHTEDILRSGTDFNITVDRSSLLPELSSLREARVRERLEGPLAIIYTNRRTGRIDPTKIAMDLKYNDRGREDSETQYRKLALHLIQKMWATQPLPPNVPYAFWDHNVMMDEYEAEMSKTEWLEASPEIQQAFLTLYEKHKAFLDALQAAQAQAIQGQQMQSAIAQATQQTAAKVAAETVSSSIQQIREQAAMATAHPPGDLIRAMMQGQQNGPQGAAAMGGPAGSARPMMPGPMRPQ